MRVKLSKAVKMFFGNSSLEMVYFEAIANALDAGATEIGITVSAQDYSQPETLTIEIEDNGIGFTDERFKKFSNLFDVDDTTHKGLGRLIYLCYFEKTLISSSYEDYFCRKFEFSDAFNEESEVVKNENRSKNGTKLSMSGYTLERLRQYSYLQPAYLKNKFLEKFYSRLFKLKLAKQEIKISITATIDGKTSTSALSTTEIPSFTSVNVEHSLDFFSKVELYYHIEEVESEASSAITAISVDNRTYPIDIIAPENFPIGHKMVFLLFSDYFNGQIDAARETINMPELEQVKRLFRNKIAQIIDEKIPQITQRNQERKQRLINRFPHLNGYFEIEGIGYASEEDLLKKAQEHFFRAQRKILGASHLTEEQFKESLELSSRALTEYILFRQNIINKLKTIDKKDKEAIIHNLIVPRYERFDAANLKNDLYRNNIWVFDDKYMTYDIILSEKEMSEVIQVITDGEVLEDDDRPDIAMIFSGNPCDENKDKKVDVVIVELKKKGIPPERNFDVETQLKKRAGKLMQYYNNKIQQIWFYGIVDFDEEFEKLVAGEYHQLFSKGKVYYKPTEVVTQINPRISFPMGIFLLDYDAMVDDADTRNSIFLNIIKSRFQN
jgi:hypothetical protein